MRQLQKQHWQLEHTRSRRRNPLKNKSNRSNQVSPVGGIKSTGNFWKEMNFRRNIRDIVSVHLVGWERVP